MDYKFDSANYHTNYIDRQPLNYSGDSLFYGSTIPTNVVQNFNKLLISDFGSDIKLRSNDTNLNKIPSYDSSTNIAVPSIINDTVDSVKLYNNNNPLEQTRFHDIPVFGGDKSQKKRSRKTVIQKKRSNTRKKKRSVKNKRFKHKE